MSALDMTPEQVATAASFLAKRFAKWPPESVSLGLCAQLHGLGYAATMANLQAVHTALVEAAKPEPLKELRINDGDATLYGCEATGTNGIATVAGYHLTPAQLRQLATWCLGAADHLEGVEDDATITCKQGPISERQALTLARSFLDRANARGAA